MQRPGAVTVFGILNIGFAALGVLGLLFTFYMLNKPGSEDNPVYKLMKDSPGYMQWMKISAPLGLLACGALLASGIGLLNLKPWGRALAIAYGVYAILFNLVGTVVSFIVLVQPLLEQAKRSQGPEAAGAIGGAFGAAFGGVGGMVYPVLLLIFMYCRNVVSAFRPRAGAPGEPPAIPPIPPQ